MCTTQQLSSAFTPVCVHQWLDAVWMWALLRCAGVFADTIYSSVCACVFVHMFVCAGSTATLSWADWTGSLSNWSSGRLSWNTQRRTCYRNVSFDFQFYFRLLCCAFLLFSSCALPPIFINPLLWCLASCPCALSVADWPWWCHGHHENVSLM